MKVKRRICPLKILVIGFAMGVFLSIAVDSWGSVSVAIRLIFLAVTIFPAIVAWKLILSPEIGVKDR